MLLALVGDIAYVGTGISSSLLDARANLKDARTALENGDIDIARDELAKSRRSARKAVELTQHPGFIALSLIPDVRAVDALTDVAELTVETGEAGLRAAKLLGVSKEGIAAAVYENGVIHFDALEETGPVLEEIEGLLVEAGALLTGAPRPALTILRDALQDATADVREASSSIHDARVLFESLPSMLGAEGERRYLLAFQALGEARATGGLVGFYGILKVTDGRISLSQLGPIAEAFPEALEAVEAPDWFKRAYGDQAALTQVQQVNVSPNFPVVSEALLDMFQQSTGTVLDGVVAMDPVALSMLLRGLDPLEIEDYDTPITADNVVDAVLHDSYLEFDSQQEQGAFLSSVIEGFWTEVRDGNVEPTAFVGGLGAAVRSQHFRMYSRDLEDQESLIALDADGGYADAGGIVQMVFHNNYGPNKVDYFLRRHIETKVQLNQDGEADIETTVTLENTAPSGPPSLLLGPDAKAKPGDLPGLNRMTLNLLMPQDADVESYEAENGVVAASVYKDEGHPVAWDVLELQPGETLKVTLKYDVEDVIEFSEETGTFTMTMFPQATVQPDSFSFRVAAPYGYELHPSDSLDDGRTNYEARGSLLEPQTFSLLLIRR